MNVVPVMRHVYDALGRGDWAVARNACGELLMSHPEFAALHHGVGLSYCGEQAFELALPHLTRASALDDANTRLRRDLGAVCAHLERWGDAVNALAPAVADLDAQGMALFLSAAVEAGCAAPSLLTLQARRANLPDDPIFLRAYGRALLASQRHVEAEAALHRCLAAEPEHAGAHDAIAHVYNSTQRPDLALRHWRESARLAPWSAYRHLRLSLALADRGLAVESRERRLTAEAIGLSRLEEHSTRLYLMLFDPDETSATVLLASREAFGSVSESARARPARARAARPTRLRVAYLSGEFRSSPAVYFFEPFLANHDRSSVEVFLYNSCPAPDHVTPRFKPWGEHWRDVAHLDRNGMARQMRKDAIDVVVDLSGHFPHNRLDHLRDPVASAHFTFPNYPSTTGCPGVDWFLTDRWTSPDGTEAEYSERLYHLPSGYLAFEPPRDEPSLSPRRRSTRPPTFGIFQRLLKFNDTVWDTLGRVLVRVPAARLVLQNGDAELGRPGSETHRMVTRQLERHGIDPARVTIHGPLPRLEHMAAVADVDVALDTFPYAGQTTTCESLWMGVPVVALPGDTHVSRVSGAIISRAGHPEWVADSPASFVEIAASLVEDGETLSRIRSRLRREFVDAGLTDGRRLARELEAAYRSVVQS